MKAIIVGAGIGGLTTALCCHHFGLQAEMIEQAADRDDSGAGIQISPNAMQVFAALGLSDALAAIGFTPQAIELRMGESGQHLIRANLGQKAIERWGAPYLHIHRADFIHVLKNALDARAPNTLRLGTPITGYMQTPDKACARLADGTQICGDTVIGADGIHSAIRAQMLGPDSPRFTGNIAWRATVPVSRLGSDRPNPVAGAWMGRGKHAVTYLLRRGDLANFVGVVERDEWTSESWRAQGTKAEALSDFSGWHPTITRLIGEADSLYRWALFDRPPLKTWTDGRVALLGDAAHPMLPFMAQGAAMAVEDAWAIAASLSKHKTIEAGLNTYQALRYERASAMQAASKANATIFHQRSTLGRLATYGPMWLAGRVAPYIALNRQDPVYSYDITAHA